MVAPTIDLLVTQKRWLDLAAMLNDRFGTNVSHEKLETIVDGKIPPKWWGDGVWMIWLKNRLSEVTQFPAKPDANQEIRFTCEMNVGFTQIEETPEMLCRLRNEKVNSDANESRSRVNKSLAEFIEPVNRVAARVV